MDKQKEANAFNNHQLDVEIKKASSQINAADSAYKALDQKYQGLNSELKVYAQSLNHIDKEKIGPMQETLEQHKISIDGLYETIEKYLIPMVADVKHLKEELALLKGTEGGNKRQKTGDDAEQS